MLNKYKLERFFSLFLKNSANASYFFSFVNRLCLFSHPVFLCVSLLLLLFQFFLSFRVMLLSLLLLLLFFLLSLLQLLVHHKIRSISILNITYLFSSLLFQFGMVERSHNPYAMHLVRFYANQMHFSSFISMYTNFI